MKLIVSGDWHIINKQPKNRIDDYPEAIIQKLEWIKNYALTNHITYILQPGDFFDQAVVPNSLLIKIAKLWSPFTLKVFTCFGQHDMLHRNRADTSLELLLYMSTDVYHKSFTKIGSKINIYYCNFGEEIPIPTGLDEYNILLIHKMIGDTHSVNYEVHLGIEFLEEHHFDLIVSGDNHKQFECVVTDPKKRILINAGSLTRKSTDQITHDPAIYVVDTEMRSYDKIKIPVKPTDEIFNMEKIIREKEMNDSMKAYVDAVNNVKVTGIDFVKNLVKQLDETENKHLLEIVKEMLDKK